MQLFPFVVCHFPLIFTPSHLQYYYSIERKFPHDHHVVVVINSVSLYSWKLHAIIYSGEIGMLSTTE